MRVHLLLEFQFDCPSGQRNEGCELAYVYLLSVVAGYEIDNFTDVRIGNHLAFR